MHPSLKYSDIVKAPAYTQERVYADVISKTLDALNAAQNRVQKSRSFIEEYMGGAYSLDKYVDFTGTSYEPSQSLVQGAHDVSKAVLSAVYEGKGVALSGKG